MDNESSKSPLGRMNRRKMLGTTTALVGGAVAGVAGNAFGQEKPKPRRQRQPSPAAGPNLNPPVVQVKGGTLRGLREGKTSSFLGIRYAEAERFGPPKPVQPWEGIKNAQVWGPVCPSPEQTTVSSDELVFPHRYWVANEHCQYLNVWTQNLTPAAKKPVMVWMHGGGFTNGSSMESYAYDGRTPQRVRRRRGRQRQPPAEHSRHARSVGLRPAVRQLALHRHGRPGGGAASGCATTSSASAAIPAT